MHAAPAWAGGGAQRRWWRCVLLATVLRRCGCVDGLLRNQGGPPRGGGCEWEGWDGLGAQFCFCGAGWEEQGAAAVLLVRGVVQRGALHVVGGGCCVTMQNEDLPGRQPPGGTLALAATGMGSSPAAHTAAIALQDSRRLRRLYLLCAPARRCDGAAPAARDRFAQRPLVYLTSCAHYRCAARGPRAVCCCCSAAASYSAALPPPARIRSRPRQQAAGAGRRTGGLGVARTRPWPRSPPSSSAASTCRTSSSTRCCCRRTPIQ
jgi:hypothetical protein